jgi:hypothetical protein
MSLATSHPASQAPIFDTNRAQAFRIIDEIAGRHSLTRSDLYSESRARNIVAARREAAWAVAKATNIAVLAIARLLRKDHTSIIHGIRRMNEDRGENVRGLGGVPQIKRERDLKAARKANARPQLAAEAEALALFRNGYDTVAIAEAMGWKLHKAANALARARDRERASQ